jgi:hypothetical protein
MVVDKSKKHGFLYEISRWSIVIRDATVIDSWRWPFKHNVSRVRKKEKKEKKDIFDADKGSRYATLKYQHTFRFFVHVRKTPVRWKQTKQPSQVYIFFILTTSLGSCTC